MLRNVVLCFRDNRKIQALFVLIINPRAAELSVSNLIYSILESLTQIPASN